MDDLPAVHVAGLAKLTRPERRRFDVLHPARHRDLAVGVGDFERVAGDGVVADAAGMDIGLVGQVHEIVDDQPVITLQAVEGAAFADPGLIAVPVEIRDLVGIGQGRIAHPDPDQPVSFDCREGLHAGGRVDGFLRRHVGAAADRIEDEAVVAADHLIAVQVTERERQQAVPAGVFQRHDLTVGSPVQDDVFAADRARRQLALDLVIPGRGIPRVHGPRLRGLGL